MEIKCQLDATEVFITVLTACSTCFGHHYAHHQELKSIIQWLLPLIFPVVVFKLLVWRGAEGYVYTRSKPHQIFTFLLGNILDSIKNMKFQVLAPKLIYFNKYRQISQIGNITENQSSGCREVSCGW